MGTAVREETGPTGAALSPVAHKDVGAAGVAKDGDPRFRSLCCVSLVAMTLMAAAAVAPAFTGAVAAAVAAAGALAPRPGDMDTDKGEGKAGQGPAKRRRVLSSGGDGGDGNGGGGGGGRSSKAGPRVGGLTRTLAAMKQQPTGSKSGSGSGQGEGPSSTKTKFHELLVDGWESRNGREAFMEELRLQARLAKKLGKKSKNDALDGMDKLMGFLSAGSGSMLPRYLDPESRQMAEDLLVKSGSGSGADQGSRSKAPAKSGQQPANAAAAARQVAEILDRESDEELEFFGIDPGNSREGDDEGDGEEEGSSDGEDLHDMYDMDLGSESEDEDDDGDAEGEVYSSSDDEDDGGSGGREGGLSSEETDGDDEDEDDEDDGDEDEDEEEYDMLGHLMGSDSEDARDAGAVSKGGDEDDDDDEDADEDDEDGDGDDDDDDDEEEDDRGQDDEIGDDVLRNQRRPSREVLTSSRTGGSQQQQQQQQQQKYVPPALRGQLAAAAATAVGGGGGGGGDAARVQVERRVTGLINRLAEANLQAISRDVAELYRTQGRRLVSEAVAAQILGAAESGPRASEQFAAVAAAFVAAIAAQTEAQDLAAGFLAALAERLEGARGSGDSLAQANLVTLLAYCYSAGLVAPGLCYSLLAVLKERFQEADVAAMVTLLNAVGLQLRNADPGLMKEFVLGVHERAAQLGREGNLSRRAQLMLDLIIDIKNNKTSAAGGAAASVALAGNVTRKGKTADAAAGAGGGGRRGGALAVLQPSVAKWLQQLGVEEVCLRGLTWQKLLAPNKKGMWWMPVAGEALDDPLMLAAAGGGGGGGSVGAASATATATGAGGGGAAATAASTARLLQLAAAQRMNTDARRAVFVAIMGSEDCREAHEKLLRLPLKGDQRREIVRVLVDSCLGEKTWNPYYGFLALRLCGGGGEGGTGGGGSVGRAHRVTMQYCLWDKFKELESIDVRPLTHLAKLAALLVARFALSLSLLKVVDWSDLTAKQLLTWRIFMQHLLSSCKTAGDVKQVFARVASQPKLHSFVRSLPRSLPPLRPPSSPCSTLSPLISGLLLFLRSSFAPWVAIKLPPGPESDELLRRTRVAEKELAAGEGRAAAVVI
ncbi:hypothetical protein VOLCADRAFT_91452 [Volvox carteri f. nagariensis]|uniref:MI domain-containing protein n=1 Tax=Volvox carteri f. nagariensis TaxID=3068 RepID=D8TX44_VOLCA|nr:uncharacterized protein VOLCADRAFT_91452 [Volvox carteri f. nagariensis]EFJ47843.1 hypothetical protein VOLCADRAFT_91452 [Volvox carteri f. nagariensis]|eukprot:XP_002950949.1 hypothetical protein VOLCADRAFT_91452 [Volvox carteri f. nagariensis]